METKRPPQPCTARLLSGGGSPSGFTILATALIIRAFEGVDKGVFLLKEDRRLDAGGKMPNFLAARPVCPLFRRFRAARMKGLAKGNDGFACNAGFIPL